MAYPVYTCTEERFLNDVRNHQMTVIRDDGIDRHLRFKRPDSGCYWFDIVTWQDVLVIRGDCGSYMFSRIEDMFQFFRTAKDDWNYNRTGGLSINPSYWGEKLLAVNNEGMGKGNIHEFSEEKFKDQVKDYFDQHFQDEVEEEAAILADVTEDNPLSEKELQDLEDKKEKREALWESIEDTIRWADNEYSMQQAIHDFDEDGFQFQDFFERDCTIYDHQYIWNIYAIAWAIRTYDESKVVAVAVEATA